MKIFPLYPGKNVLAEKQPVLSVEITDEATLFALYQNGDSLTAEPHIKRFSNTEFPSVNDIIKSYVKENPVPGYCAAAVSLPGPVISNKAYVPRLTEEFSAEELKEVLGLKEVFLLNDLEAKAYGLAEVKTESFLHIHNENEDAEGNVALMAPGNGLGEAGLFFDGEYLHPFATEGGHSEFSPRTNVEVEFYQYLNKIYGIVSWENVLSHQGLFNIFRFLRDEKHYPVSQKLNAAVSNSESFATTLYEAAITDRELIATVTLNTFLEFLARECNSLVLKLKAVGGLIITGSLIRLFAPYIDFPRFYNKFLVSDKMEALLRKTSVYILDDTHLALRGAAIYAWTKRAAAAEVAINS